MQIMNNIFGLCLVLESYAPENIVNQMNNVLVQQDSRLQEYTFPDNSFCSEAEFKSARWSITADTRRKRVKPTNRLCLQGVRQGSWSRSGAMLAIMKTINTEKE